MFKIFKKFMFIFIIFTNNAIAFTNNTIAENSHNLTIQLGNLSFSQMVNLPKHDFFYEMTIPASEIFKGAPLIGKLSPDNADLSTVIYRFDFSDVEVNLNISDPAMGNRTIWKGKIVYDLVFNKVESIPDVVDNLHYGIYINIVQPNQGRPQFIIGIVSI